MLLLLRCGESDVSSGPPCLRHKGGLWSPFSSTNLFGMEKWVGEQQLVAWLWVVFLNLCTLSFPDLYSAADTCPLLLRVRVLPGT